MSVFTSVVKRPLKRLRAFGPFNRAVTGVARAVVRMGHVESEFVIKHLIRVGVVSAPLPGGRTLTLWSKGDDWISNQVFWRGWDGYETETAGIFFRLATRARVTLDVGAYVGFYSLLAAHANPEGRVFAFEPSPVTFARLLKNVGMNRLQNVECAQAAVGAHAGDADFFFSTTEELPLTSTLAREFVGHYEDLGRLRVPVVTLDEFLAARSVEHVDLVKIDTETTEPAVLDGLAKTLDRDRPDIFCEVHADGGTEGAIEERLDRYGYRSYHLTPAGMIERRPADTNRRVWRNYLFTVRKSEELPAQPIR